jgi:hypothetical protein
MYLSNFPTDTRFISELLSVSVVYTANEVTCATSSDLSGHFKLILKIKIHTTLNVQYLPYFIYVSLQSRHIQQYPLYVNVYAYNIT